MNAIVRSYRSLWKRPAFFLAVVFTLMLGIGANSAIFSVIDAVLLRPLPYPDGDRLMALFESNPRKRLPHEDVAPVRVEEWNRLNTTFDGIAGAYTESVAETSGELPEMLICARVSPRFFSVLGTPPLLGRTFRPDEDLDTGPAAAVISERLWRRRYAADPKVIGTMLQIGRGGYPIVGVAPASVEFPSTTTDFWIPAKLPGVVMRNREARFHSAIGRLKAGVSAASAQSDLNTIQAGLTRQFPATDSGWSPLVEPLKEQSVHGVRKSLWVLYAAVSLVLLIACANVACLLLAQAHRRRREIAVRFTLGARRRQVVGVLLLESLCLALPGAALGLALSQIGASLFRRAAALLPRANEIHLDWRIVVFTLVLSILTTLLFGLVPALSATHRPFSSVLAQNSRTQIGGGHSLERMLVSAQLALAIVLLIGAGLFIRSLSQLGQVSLGFTPDHVLTFRVSAGWGEVNNIPRVVQRMYRTLEVLRGIPGVELSAITLGLPGGGQEYTQQFGVVGRDTDSEGAKVFAGYESVTPDYFQTLGIPIFAGQTCRLNFDAHPASEPVLVSRTFADRYFPNENVIGRHLTLARRFDAAPFEIVGVVADIRKNGYAQAPAPVVYWCGIPGFYPDPAYLIKTAGDPLLALEAVRRKVREIEPNRAVYDARRLRDYVATSLVERRFQIVLLSSFAVCALLLGVIGLYGVTSFLVSQRTREIGLRVALGAQPSQIFGQIFAQGALMTGSGIALGLAASAVLSRFVSSFLFGVRPTDPITYVAVPFTLAAVAALALWSPARRATQVDPMQALRQD